MVEERVIAVILAAGSSSRMGGLVPKLLLPLGNRAVINWTLTAFEKAAGIDSVVLASRLEEQESYRTALADVKRPLSFVVGGEVRQASVWNVLQYLAAGSYDPLRTFVLIHDAARCFVTAELIERTIRAVREHLAVTTAVPAVDSVKEVAPSGRVLRSLERQTLWLVQTPQAFRLDLLLRAHRDHPGSATDDASLVEMIHSVQVVPGERRNFKLTTPEDYSLAQALALRQTDH